MNELPVGVFDSGVGGLTVLRALKEQLPQENFIYLGDTARLPYGTKSAATITRYALQAAELLVERGVKCLVIACNTASAVSLDELRNRFIPLPVLGVIEPGADAGCHASKNGNIAVIATESTIQGDAYGRAIAQRRPQAQVFARACSLFVALAEEGVVSGPIAEGIARHYLLDLFQQRNERGTSDTLLLGCTHFPPLRDTIRAVLPSSIQIVDSAETTAAALHGELKNLDLLNDAKTQARMQLLATDGPARFARVGRLFLDSPIDARDVELVEMAPSSSR
jgi:glutamate racemase